ncbi:glycosyltransferase family 4 protein [Pseudomonas sp. TNT2022 ID233]|uniref:glycosyltransferase family 4 protein n=1 Tax=Pseudomonas aphyarum TaxID=2942629 RepID=UPI002362F3FC|nr:glycosyltransferase family 4 protein [Pseudomonas aphyarum]MDD1141286.1 glycosyltransferase family 4 protein [Pseudomonas aphyarum]
MKVLVWTQYFWPENFHINEVVAELTSQGAEVTVLTGKPNYPEGRIFPGYRSLGCQTEDYKGAKVIRLPLYPRGKNSAKGLILNYLSFILSGYLLGPWVLRGLKFDVVFVYAPSPLLQALPAIYVSWLKRARLALWVQDIWPESLKATGFVNNGKVLKGIEYVVRYIYRYSDAIMIQSEGFRDSVQRLCRDSSKIKFFPNSALDPVSTKVPDSFDLGRLSRHFSVVFAGNIGVAQSCQTIVEAAKILRDHSYIRFFLVGSGSMETAIAEMIERERLDNVELTGRVSSEEITSVYAASSVLLLTLRDDPIFARTIPSKFQSYLAAGKPIIASCNGQTTLMLAEADAGLSCAAQDPQALADAVLALYDTDQQRLAEMGQRGREFFLNHFYLPGRVAQLIDYFNDLSVNKSR